jgi:hypothetical protein
LTTSWETNVVVFANDDKKGLVVCGHYGFAWCEKQRWNVAKFEKHEEFLMTGFAQFSDWSSARKIPLSTPMLAILRFVRTGLWP